MKNLITILMLMLIPFAGKADVADDVAAAIRTGKASEVSKYFADNVDLKVLEQENIYAKAQAELILADFFNRHPVKAFTIVHKSVPKNDSQFAIGTLETTNGKYRVHYLMKTITGKTSVTQFRIENSDEE
ncbi:MAG: DUF4783 domain-containing protein [Bacteroidia bacterium]|jgi:hypothetical protein|nr:DUF4783 domain-containing protein [Bacteroidia bacterium]